MKGVTSVENFVLFWINNLMIVRKYMATQQGGCVTTKLWLCVCVGTGDKYGALLLSLSLSIRLSGAACCAERVANQKRNLILDAGYLHILLTQTAGTRGPENSVTQSKKLPRTEAPLI